MIIINFFQLLLSGPTKMNAINKILNTVLIACLSTFAFSTSATQLSDVQIQADLEGNPLYVLDQSSQKYQRATTAYIEESAPSEAMDLAGFYAQLKENYEEVLGEPTYVPIGVGDITTIIPIFDEPRYVGSPLVQSRYVRYQIRNLLGRNLIDADSAAYTDEAAQLNTLYNNAFYYIQNEAGDIEYGDRLGLDTSASGLAKDIVWPERRTINGEEVIVPIVYLTSSTYQERKVTDHETTFNSVAAFGNLTIDQVAIEFGREAFLTVAGELNNYRGLILGNGDLQIFISGMLNNISALIKAENDLKIAAHTINSETIVHRYDYGDKKGGYFGEIAGINSENGDIYLSAYDDILIQGAVVGAPNGAITFEADGDIYIGSVQYHSSSEREASNYYSYRSRTHILQSNLTAEDSIKLIAEGEIAIDAADIVSDQGHIELLAKLGITVQDQIQESQRSYFRSSGDTTTQIEAYRTVAIRSLLDAGKSLVLHTEFGDINLAAVEIVSENGTSATADSGGVNLLTTVEHDHFQFSSVTESFLTISSENRGHNLEVAVPNTILGGFTAEALYGVKVEYEGDPNLGLDAQLMNISELPGMSWVLDVRNTMPSAEFQALELEYDKWNEKNTSLSPAAIALVSVVAAMAVGPAALEVGKAAAATNVGSFIGAGTTQAAVTAGVTTFTTQASIAGANGLVNGDIKEAMEEFIESDETWTSVATSMLTAGVIEAVDAQFFRPSDADVQSLADARGWGEIAPGSVEYELLYTELSHLSLGMQAIQVASHTAIRAGIVTAVNEDLEFDEAFRDSLLQYGVEQLGEYMATQISGAFDTGNSLDEAFRYISHAAAGCVIGGMSASISDVTDLDSACVSGAGGAVVGEIIATSYRDTDEYLDAKNALDEYVTRNNEFIRGLVEDQYTNEQIDIILSSDSYYAYQLARLHELRRKGVNLSRLGAALTAFIAGADAAGVNIAADTGTTAAQYNGLLRESYEAILESIDQIEREVAGFFGVTLKVENGGIILLPDGADEFKRAVNRLGNGDPIYVSAALHEFLMQVSGDYRTIALINGNGNQYSTEEILNIFTQFYNQDPENVQSLFDVNEDTPYPSFIAVGAEDSVENLLETAKLALGGRVTEQEFYEINQLIMDSSDEGNIINLSTYMSRAVLRTYFANSNFLSEYQKYLNNEVSSEDFLDAFSEHISVIPNGILESIGRDFETAVDGEAPPHMRSASQRMAGLEIVMSLPYKTIMTALRGTHETVTMTRLADEIAAAEVNSLTERELFQSYLTEYRTLALVDDVADGGTWYVQSTIRPLHELIPAGGIPNGVRRLRNWLDGLSARELESVLINTRDGVWGLPSLTRGRIIESYLAKTEYQGWFNVGDLHNGFFPLVDFQSNMTLVSVKSANTTSSYWAGTRLDELMGHIDDLATRRATIWGEPVEQRILDVRVQPGGFKDAESLVQYGANRDVLVIINEVDL